jgi:hypothetical protein
LQFLVNFMGFGENPHAVFYPAFQLLHVCSPYKAFCLS